MVKYRLIKTYPGSPELGYVVIKETLNWSQLKDYPEFWEEVIEKDYEILSLIEGKFIYPCDKYSKDYVNQLFNTLGVSIHSVKRISDDEIFTVGDKILVHENEYILDKLYLQNNKLYYNIYDDFSKGSDLFNKSVKKVKQPLLSLSDVWDNLKVKDQKEVLKFVKSKLNK